MRWLAQSRTPTSRFLNATLPLAVILSLPRSAHTQASVSTLPATSPTSVSQPLGTASPAPSSLSNRRALVDYSDGLLKISASNSSLNQILREVGRLTGMKITGGVQDDRVFGTYGPAPASEVLNSLLDGTSSNVLIVANASNGPAELILSPRLGGPSPPNPSAARADISADPTPSQRSVPGPQFLPRAPGPSSVITGPPNLNGLPPSNGGQTGAPIDGGADLGTTPGAFIPAGQTPPDATAQIGVQSTAPAATTVPSDPSQPQSPNGTSTPQQIYEQLMKLRQQQQTSPQ